MRGNFARARGRFNSASHPQATSDPGLKLPLNPESVRFAVIGDNGTGNAPQFEVARQMEAYYEMVNYSFVIMLGDNIYGRHSPADFVRKFEQALQTIA